ncbi:hypothetical protein [Paenirhodobacter populi]|uniref:hypothetical protein n=1 Tax=Paenirhodobacter populi TaxID=2306993 RepID=UPI0019D4B24F|nr:hypothetical protein [Sinirhodobacter populi]
MPPSEVKALTLWEFSACVVGWNKSQGKSHSVEGEPLSDEAYDALCELGDSWNG